MQKRTGYSLLFLLFVFSVAGQQTDFLFRNITINDGLSQSSIVDITSDSSGFMWFATQDGLNKYDGKHFRIFPEVFDDITSPTVSQLGKLVVQKNHLWMIVAGGKLKKLDLKTEKRISVETITSKKIKLPLVSNLYFDKDKTIWIATKQFGLWKWNTQTDKLEIIDKNSTSPLSSNAVKSIYADSKNGIWVLTDNGLNYFYKQVWTKFLSGKNLSSITEDESGNMWVGTLGNGIYLKKKLSENYIEFNGYVSNILPDKLTISSVIADGNGLLWAGTYGSGLFIINEKNKSITHLEAERRNKFALQFNDILSLYKDINGGVWIGTDGGGLSHFSKQLNYFSLLSVSNLPEEISIAQVRSVYTDNDEEIWIGTSGNGLTYINKKAKKYFTHNLKPYKPGVANFDRIVSLYGQGNDLWVGTQGNGLLVLDKNTLGVKKWFNTDQSSHSLNIPDNTIWCISPVDENRILAGTRNGGLLFLDRNKGLLKVFSSYGGQYNIINNNIRSIAKVNDSVFCIGFERKGIQFFNINKEEFYNSIPLTKKDEPGQEIVLKNLKVIGDLIWVGTAGDGIALVEIKKKSVRFINVSNGLPNNTVYGVLEGKNNELWISSNNGVARFTYEKKLDGVNVNNILSFTEKDGLQSNEFNTGAFFRSENGLLYFGGIMGLNIINTEKVRLLNYKIPIILTNISINNKPFDSDTLVNFKKVILLSYSKNSFSFTYSAIDFIAPEKIKYEYKLDNYDKEWVQADNRDYAAYTNLRPGNYRVMVRIAGKPETEISQLNIIVASPFWEKWWFIVLVIAAVFGILYAIYKFRINQILKMQLMRNEISADLHDDIGSRLTNVQLFSALAKKNESMTPPIVKYLSNIEKEVAASSEALDEIVWNMKAKDETIEVMIARMRRYAGEVLESDDMAYQFNVIDNSKKRSLSMQKKRDIYLLYKEILNNICKHATASTVKINISLLTEEFKIEINDNGVGFDTSVISNRSGLFNIRQRAEKHGGKVKISSSPGNGTLIKVLIPYDRASPIKMIFRT